MKRYVLELLKEQWEIVRLAEHTKNKTDVGCLVFADVLTLTCIFFCLIAGALLLQFISRSFHPTTRALPASRS